MIITRLHGGLGNQMFQYAAGRALVLRYGGELALDLRYFEDAVPYGFGLPHFAAVFREARSDELPPHQKRQPLRYATWRALKLSPRLVREKGLGFNAHVPTISSGAYLHGYWQSEKYFADVADEMRAELSVTTPPTEANRALLERIRSGVSVSLHVRRGDYANDPAIAAAYGLLSPNYFAAAVDLVRKRIASRPTVYAFSDDPDWAEANLRFDLDVVVVRGNDSETSYEDLRLMSACNHHITANSSFSWWGAWLNPSPDKVVVAPKRWFANRRMNNPDICPDGWERV